MTEAEYLAADEKSERPVEWIGGILVEREGASLAHCQIATRLLMLLRAENRETFGSLMRVHIEETGENFYPDLAAFSPVKMHPTMPDTLLNPVVVAEILSPTTDARDRENKLYSYRQIESLQHYLLASQDRVLVHHYSRLDETRWEFAAFHWRRESVALSAINVSIPLEEIYRNLDVPQGLVLVELPEAEN